MEDSCQGAQEGGLAEAGDAFEEDVAAREQADEDAVDDVLLADDDFSNFRADEVQSDTASGRAAGWGTEPL